MKRTLLHILWLLFCTLSVAGCDLDMESLEDSMDPEDGGPVAVVFHLDGDMPEFDDPGAMFGPPGPTQQRLLRLLKKASRDLLVQEIVIHVHALPTGWARAAEIADGISKAAKHKPVTCLLESADNLTYWMAARACPRILAAPAGGVDLIGLSMETVYLREMLDALGIEADMMSVGRYKNAAENLLRNDMSPDAREASQSLLDDLSFFFIADIAKGRKLDKKKVKDLVDGGPYTAAAAKKKGLVDDISTLAALMHALGAKYEGGVVTDYGRTPPKEMDLAELLKLFSGDTSSPADDEPRIAIIPVIGTINSGIDQGGFPGSSEAVYDITLIENLMAAGDDEAVKAVVLRIDSPGGSALASDNIWEAVSALARKKPVVASMGDVAASGGYYIASAAEVIFAQETTITGSIGVVGGKIVIANGLSRIGIHRDGVETAERAGMMSPMRPFTDDERKDVLASMQHIYQLFVRRVAQGRDLKKEDVLAVAEGRVWSGKQAKEHHLVDRFGGLSDAIDQATRWCS